MICSRRLLAWISVSCTSQCYQRFLPYLPGPLQRSSRLAGPCWSCRHGERTYAVLVSTTSDPNVSAETVYFVFLPCCMPTHVLIILVTSASTFIACMQLPGYCTRCCSLSLSELGSSMFCGLYCVGGFFLLCAMHYSGFLAASLEARWHKTGQEGAEGVKSGSV